MSVLKSTRRNSKTQVAIFLFSLIALLVFIAMGVPPTAADFLSTSSSVLSSSIDTTNAITSHLYLPFIGKNISCPIPGGSYATLAVLSDPTDRPAELHADLNLALRGYTPTVSTLGLVDLGGTVADPSAPQLATLFVDNRVPIFKHVYQVYDWDWTNNVRGQPLTDWNVTLAGVGMSPGESVCVPSSGYNIGHLPIDYEALVLYASTNRITLKYTRDDNVKLGYTIHIENISVDPGLLALYQSMNSAGRGYLPALFVGQYIGRAITTEIQIAIRDAGEFMDPRSHGDWWQGK